MYLRKQLLIPAILLSLLWIPTFACSDSGESTRVTKQHAQRIPGGYPYREKAEYVLEELDLHPGDTVVDIGAGDGWWTERMAEEVGEEGTIHAGEISEEKVERLKKNLKEFPQVRPYLCPTDGTGLEENSCDLVFLSKTFHHIDSEIHVDYFKHLRKVVRPDGRLVVIEHHPVLAKGRAKEHGWMPGDLISKAEEAGWILVRAEMITRTHHFVTIFIQKEAIDVAEDKSKK
jgi:ubiquinone/menaquinone biosynthesis C-methylase UbiE